MKVQISNEQQPYCTQVMIIHSTYSVVNPGHSHELTSTGTNLRSAAAQSMSFVSTSQTQSKGHSQPEGNWAAVNDAQRLNESNILASIIGFLKLFVLLFCKQRVALLTLGHVGSIAHALKYHVGFPPELIVSTVSSQHDLDSPDTLSSHFRECTSPALSDPSLKPQPSTLLVRLDWTLLKELSLFSVLVSDWSIQVWYTY